MDFAVKVAGLDEGTERARWVLAVDGDRLLTAHDDGSLHWYPLADCRLAKAINPESPKTVIPVQPSRPQVIPGLFKGGV